MPQVIEWKNPGEDDIVWRYPEEEITWGAQLIVHEYEYAVFFRDGKAYDVFGPGRHTLTTQNLPLLTEYLTKLIGYPESPFKATVIFVSSKQFRGKFGGQGQTVDLAPLKFFGSFWFRVSDPKLFVMEVVGGQKLYETDKVNEFLRGFLNERLITQLSKYDLVTVFTKLEEVSFKTKVLINEEFKRIGLELIDLKFEGIDTTEEYRDRLFWIRQTGGQAAYVLKMETAESMAKELGKSPGAGLGAGMMLIPPVFAQPPPQTPPPPSYTQPPPTTTVKCPKCGMIVDARFNYCPYCGAQLPKPGVRYCPNCGAQVPPNAKFCPNCGKQL
ncbi:MAG: hypothetical protein DRO65_03525 [Candidatus Altiarchaeales archaeon]|nr:MAG: hypothetical protein DRO65_03525 [Candidatus Altiarchaeales archaeon]